MINIPYRTRRNLKRAGLIALVVFVCASLIYLCWFLWLGRYVIYTRDNGAQIDQSQDPQVQEGNIAQKPESETVSIYYNEGENAINTSRELTQIIGYYADKAALEDLAGLQEIVKNLPTGSPVMMDVKDGKGRFFYTSGLSGDHPSGLDIAGIDELIKQLDKKGMYLIARLPAFRDYAFGLSNTSNGLHVASGGYLWADDDYCYWLDPTKQGTITHLIDIVTELKALGFDEVVFDNFCFPDTQDLNFSGDQTEALNTAAKTLLTSCATGNFALSFINNQEGFQLPQGRSRLYMTDVAAAQAAAVAASSGVTDPLINLVFLTEVHDTRFDAYSVLRPIQSAG